MFFRVNALVASLMFTASANVSACGPTTILSTETGNQRIELIIDDNKIAKAPAWTPVMGEPPISLSKASAIALAWAKNHYKRFDSVVLREIVLAEYPSCSGNSERWYYRFEFVPIIEDNRVYGSGNWAALLMDGTMLAPTTKSKTPKQGK